MSITMPCTTTDLVLLVGYASFELATNGLSMAFSLHCKSDGELNGPTAEFFKAQTRSSVPVMVQVRTVKKFAEAGCARLQATLAQDAVPTQDGKRIPFVVRYELNLCRDGQPPTEGIDLDATSKALSR